MSATLNNLRDARHCTFIADMLLNHDTGLLLLFTFILLQPSFQALLPSRCGQEATALTEIVKVKSRTYPLQLCHLCRQPGQLLSQQDVWVFQICGSYLSGRRRHFRIHNILPGWLEIVRCRRIAHPVAMVIVLCKMIASTQWHLAEVGYWVGRCVGQRGLPILPMATHASYSSAQAPGQSIPYEWEQTMRGRSLHKILHELCAAKLAPILTAY